MTDPAPSPPGAPGVVAARSVLVVAPHFDDETLGCGGLLAQLAAAGAVIRVLYLTDGAAAAEPGGREARGSGGSESFIVLVDGEGPRA